VSLDRPRIRHDLTYHPEERDDRTVVYVRDALRSYIVGLNEMQVSMMRLLDGRRTHAEIAAALEEQYEVEIPDEKVTRFVAYLEERMLLDVTAYDASSEPLRAEIRRLLKKRGLLDPPPVVDETARLVDEALREVVERSPTLAAKQLRVVLDAEPDHPRARAALDAIHEGFFRAHRTVAAHMKMFHLWNPDRFLGAVDRAVGRVVYSRWGVALLGVCALSAVPAIVRAEPTPWSALRWWDAPLLLLVLLPEYFVHEVLGHGLACKHFGGQVDDTGAMLFHGVIPGAYTNVIDVHRFRDKRQRIIVYLAGVAAQVPMLAMWWNVYAHTSEAFFLRHAIYLWLVASVYMIGKNLVPTIEGMDAYYAIEHGLDVPDLAPRSAQLLRDRISARILGTPRPAIASAREEKILLVFGAARVATALALVGVVIAVVLPLLFSWSTALGIGFAVFFLYGSLLKPAVSGARWLGGLVAQRRGAAPSAGAAE
jgi:hypothetical protein